jgi:organic hydroperoxide reductase OsmC/OhrA
LAPPRSDVELAAAKRIQPMTTRTATARYDGFGKEGKGHITTQSGVLTDQFYGFNTRFGDEKGTNPEELIAAAHAGCFTMALSFALATAGFGEGTLESGLEAAEGREQSRRPADLEFGGAVRDKRTAMLN